MGIALRLCSRQAQLLLGGWIWVTPNPDGSTRAFRTRPYQGLRFPQHVPLCEASPDLLICHLAVFVPPPQPFQFLQGIPKTPPCNWESALCSSRAASGLCYPGKGFGTWLCQLIPVPFPLDLQLGVNSLLLVALLGTSLQRCCLQTASRDQPSW